MLFCASEMLPYLKWLKSLILIVLLPKIAQKLDLAIKIAKKLDFPGYVIAKKVDSI